MQTFTVYFRGPYDAKDSPPQKLTFQAGNGWEARAKFRFDNPTAEIVKVVCGSTTIKIKRAK